MFGSLVTLKRQLSGENYSQMKSRPIEILEYMQHLSYRCYAKKCSNNIKDE